MVIFIKDSSLLAPKSIPVVACLLMDTIQISSYSLSAALWPQQSSCFSTNASNLVLNLVMQMLKRLKSLMLCILGMLPPLLIPHSHCQSFHQWKVRKVDQAWLTCLLWLILNNFSGLVSCSSRIWKHILRGHAPWSFLRQKWGWPAYGFLGPTYCPFLKSTP